MSILCHGNAGNRGVCERAGSTIFIFHINKCGFIWSNKTIRTHKTYKTIPIRNKLILTRRYKIKDHSKKWTPKTISTEIKKDINSYPNRRLAVSVRDLQNEDTNNVTTHACSLFRLVAAD